MKIKQTLLAIVLSISLVGIMVAPTVLADCGGTKTSIVNCNQGGGTTVESTGIWGLLILVINILSAGVVIAAIGGVVYGSIMYTTSGGSVEQTKKARAIIANTIVGIVLFLAMSAFLNYIIPGGMFSTSPTSTPSTTTTTSTPSSPAGTGGGFSSGSGTGSSTGGGGSGGGAD